MSNSELIIQNWGSDVEYQSAWDRQRELHHKIVTENHPDVAVLLEHQNVYTAGRSTKPEDRPTDSSPFLISIAVVELLGMVQDKLFVIQL